MKLRNLGAVVFAAALLAAGCQAAPGESTAPSNAAASPSTAGGALGTVTIGPSDPIHIAFWGVLSGADATLGQDSEYGVKVAIQDAGSKLLGHDISLTTEDGLCTPEGGATAAQKLASDPTIVGLIGPNCSDEVVGGIKAISDAGMTTISMSATRPALTDPSRGPDYAGFLRTAHSDSFQGKTVAEFLYNQLHLTTMATIQDGSAYAQALQQVAADDFTQLGGTVCDQEAVGKDDTDMHPVLTKISTSCSGSAPQALYYPIFIAAGGFITAQVRDVTGMDQVVLIGSDGLFSPDFITAAGTNATGMYLSSPDFSKFNQDKYTQFLTEYKDLSGGAPLSIFHAHAYDATNILFAAIQKVAQTAADGTITIDRQALRDAIYATKDFQGITGTLTCSENGDCGAPIIAIYQITADAVSDPAHNWPPAAPIWP
jgi:branched-chain amino acid transport system substrate-binding protein